LRAVHKQWDAPPEIASVPADDFKVQKGPELSSHAELSAKSLPLKSKHNPCSLKKKVWPATRDDLGTEHQGKVRITPISLAIIAAVIIPLTPPNKVQQLPW
jgi:hypothetical protein